MPTSAVEKRLPPAPFDVRTTGAVDPHGGGEERSPPRTPAWTGAARLAGRSRPSSRPSHGPSVRVPTARETFLDDSTPVDEVRDSHELTLRARPAARESLMDSMLLSLDRYGDPVPVAHHRRVPSIVRSQTLDDVQLYGSRSPEEREEEEEEEEEFEEEAWRLSSRYRPRRPGGGPGRRRGHSYSASGSSECEMAWPDENSSRASTIVPRPRRSDSGSNVSSTMLERIDSRRGAEHHRGPYLEAQRALPPSPRRPARYWSGRGKSSASSSFDAGYVQLYGTTRWATTTTSSTTTVDPRPGSIDRAGYRSRSDSLSGGLVSHAWSQPASHDVYDAAPPPVVPAGPSRRASPERSRGRSPPGTYRSVPPLSMGTKDLAGPPPRTPYGRKGMLDDAGASSPSGRPAGYGPGQDFKILPALPAYTDAPAPGPTVAYGRSAPPPPGGPAPRAKERPGFFRRVFGSSKHSMSAPPPQDPRREPSEGRSRWRATSTEAASPARPPPSKSPRGRLEKALPAAPEQPPPLTKKPSSFFRRRKKSISQGDALPSMPLPSHPTDDADLPERTSSPASSLRKTMDPYIKEPLESPDGFYASGDLTDARVEPAAERGRRLPSDAGLIQQTDSTRTSKIDLLEPGERDEAKSRSASCRCPFRRRFASPRTEGTHGWSDSGRGSTPARDVEAEKRPMTVPSTSTALEVQGLAPAPPRPRVEPPERPWSAATMPADEVAALGSTNGSKPSRQDTAGSENSVSAREERGRPARRADDDDRRIPTPTTVPETAEAAAMGDRSTKGSRVWLEPTASEESLTGGRLDSLSTNLVSPAKASPSAASHYTTASSGPLEKSDDLGLEDVVYCESPQQDQACFDEPTADDHGHAKKLFDGEDDMVDQQSLAAWLGGPGPVRARVRKAYLELFDWQNLSILTAMRELCSNLVLKAETQQVDRILDAVSARWCECNPNHGFKATDVVHTICYSILLLNTDLHLADIEQKMTRSQFIKNTLPTIRRVVEDAAPGAFEPGTISTIGRSRASLMEPGTPNLKSFPDAFSSELDDSRTSVDTDRRSRRLSYRPSHWEESRGRSPTPVGAETAGDDVGLLVKAPFQGTKRAWEAQVEQVLKSFYLSIRQQRLPLRGAPADPAPEQPVGLTPLSILTGNVLKRSPSTLSKAHSENFTQRGRSELQRLGSTGRWASKNRSRPRVYPSSMVGSSRTSFEDQSSIMTPNSSTWSKNSLSKTQTSMSVGSTTSYFPTADYQRSIGFANALSQAIIRDDTATSTSADDRVVPLLEDEMLGLVGAPWAKEGMVQHKHHMDHVERRAKDRNWNECFAVIEKGWMRLFSFSSKISMRQRNKHRPAGGVLGGGNWMENAEGVGSFLLRQTIASALPPPGYSKIRPYVWALSLPTGAVHLFQVGTPEIVKEFVSTANYWSARLSKEPLVGGISNVEYGWSDAVINQALLGVENMPPLPAPVPPPSSSGGSSVVGGRRPSIQGSIRSSMDHGASSRQRLAGDKVAISEWNPPQQSMVASGLSEVDQLQALMTYVKNVEKELERHNELRGPMLLAFSPRHSNFGKAMANWERKSCYLLREIVKFRTYCDCLTAAQGQLKKFQEALAVEGEGEGEGVGEGVEDVKDDDGAGCVCGAGAGTAGTGDVGVVEGN